MYRPDRAGPHRTAYAKNKKKILATQRACGICGQPVDMTLKNPHPLAPCVDHIIPVARGGHPSDLANLQLTHRCCNREKSDKIYKNKGNAEPAKIGNRMLPQTMCWERFGAK